MWVYVYIRVSQDSYFDHSTTNLRLRVNVHLSHLRVQGHRGLHVGAEVSDVQLYPGE